MKKHIFVDLPMRELCEKKDKQCYNGKGNTNCRYEDKVFFPINAVLAQTMSKNDIIRIILLATISEKNHTSENVEVFKKELEAINAKIGAVISYEVIESEFIESKKKHERRLHYILSKMEEEAELYADITFGQKTLPMLLMCAFNFAEKFYNADVKKIIYGKVDFIKHDDGRIYPTIPNFMMLRHFTI